MPPTQRNGTRKRGAQGHDDAGGRGAPGRDTHEHDAQGHLARGDGGRRSLTRGAEEDDGRRSLTRGAGEDDAQERLPGERGATYAEVFASGEFRVLFGGFTLMVAGEQVKMLALSALVYARTGSPGLSAAAYMLGFLPYAVGGTFLLAPADRMRPRTLMVTGELVRVVTCLLLAFAGLPVWAMLALVLVAGLFSPVFTAARSALLPGLLPGDAFVLARSVLSMTSAGAQIGGLAVGGAVLAATGPTGALASTAVLSAVAAALLRAGLPDLPARGRDRDDAGGRTTREEREAAEGGVVREPAREAAEGGAVRETLRVNRILLADTRVRGLLLAQWLPLSFVAGAEAMLVPYLGGAAGITLAAASTGLAVGNVLVGRFATPSTRERLSLPLAALAGVPLLAFALRPGAFAAALCVLLAVAAGGAYELGLQRRFVEAVPEPIRGQSFGLLTAGAMTGQGASAALVGLASEFTAPHLAIVGSGVAAVVSALALRRHLRPERL
ncbi:MFS transporter [Streptosporangium carneum]|uniref:Membrane protein n=1 Tax=Streptosporangium carneum TaxID=47481 RepID=A0A9W6ICI7_9ACTN|nr:MFS transporter [Streptosporangium carneum]GLK14945.1 membrane protein [Streptosporangium carneum]